MTMQDKVVLKNQTGDSEDRGGVGEDATSYLRRKTLEPK